MALFGAKKQVLIVGNDGVQLYTVSGKDVALYGDYSNAGANLTQELKKAFKAIGSPLVILFDVVEQQYRKEAIPKVSFLDQNKVIKRKLQMAFPQQQMHAFMKLKQKPRENESFVALFASLSNNMTIIQITDAFISSEITLAGAGLLPLESSGLVVKMIETIHKKAKTTSDTRWSVLMTHHKTGGLRQIIIKDGELALTRLTPLVVDPHNIEGLSQEMVREFNATQTYLSRFGYVPSDGLDLILVSAPEICAKIKDYRLPVTHLYTYSIQEAGALIGIKPKIASDGVVYGEVLHAGWNGTKSKLAVPLSSSVMDKVKNTRQIAQVAIFLMFLGAGYMAWQDAVLHMDITAKQNELVEQRARLVALQTEHDALAKKLNDLKYDPEKTKTFLAVYDSFAHKNLDLEPSFNMILSLIDRGSIRLQNLAVVLPLKEVADPMAPVVAPDPNAKPAKQTAIFKLSIGFLPDTSIEDAARLTKDFWDKLKARFPGRTVSIDSMVGDLSVDQTVKGVSEQVAEGRIEGNLVKDGASNFTITGEIE